MRRLRALLTASVLAATVAGGAAHAGGGGGERGGGYALVVTNNRSLDETRPDLHYADDDGAKYADLFGEVYGRDRVVLLTRMDLQTAPLYPRWAAAAREPTLGALDAAVADLARRLDEDVRAGGRPELHVVLAGHGDIDRGMGYVELMDGRLTARDLEEKVIQRLPAHRIHLILDSCNSYFMLNPRKPGGRRWAAGADADADASQGLLRRFPHVGAVISTSAEAVTYEWSELQSGIFSYEVRSGLRGAADADGDGRISYPELAAFITVANRPVVNDLYRPKVFTAPPAADGGAPVLTVQRAGRVLTIAAGGRRRLTVRDDQGVRLLDLHKEDATPVTLALPLEAEELGLFEQVDAAAAGERPTVRYRALGREARKADLDELIAAPAPYAQRGGEAPVFRGLFQEPFGRVAFARVQRDLGVAAATALPFGVSVREAERLRTHLQAGAGGAGDQHRMAGGLMLAGAGAAVGGLTWGLAEQMQDPAARVGGRVTAGAVGGALIAGGLLYGLWQGGAGGQGGMYDSFVAQDLSTEQGRARAVMTTEARMEARVREERMARMLGGWALIGAGALEAAGGGLMALSSRSDQQRLAAYGLVGVGLIGLLEGVLYLGFHRTPLERAWDLYLAEPAVSASPAVVDGKPGVSVQGRF